MTVVDDIKGRLDITEVVSQHVALQRSGRSYKANCPFHQEKTPSFHVFPDRQTWRCFGACAVGGDIFSFVMRAENLEFADALKKLADQSGVVLPSRQGRSEQEGAVEINEAACRYFREFLASSKGAEARAYLEGRGLDRDAIGSFELGLSPPDVESLKRYLVSKNYSLRQQAQAGLVRVAEDGWAADLFRGRLMIPIRDGSGELVGFGGRTLNNSNPKYLNSPRTSTFDKGRLLYGLHLAKATAAADGLVVVEGYMDVIAAHQQGFKNVVASMGTALTENQVAAIRRLTSKVTMALDADAAGQQATLRSLESSWQVFQAPVAGRARGITMYQHQPTLELKIAVLPPGQDPDDVIRESPDRWLELVENAAPLMDYLFSALSAQGDVNTPQGKARLVELMFPLIAAVPEPTQQDQYFQSLADHLGVTQDTLRATIGRPTAVRRSRGAAPASRGATPTPFAKLDRDPLEEYCLALVLQNNELQELADSLRPEYLQRLENKEILSQLTRAGDDGPSGQGPVVDAILTRIDQELVGHLDSLLQKTLPPMQSKSRRGAFLDAVWRLEQRYLRELKAEEEIRFREAPLEWEDETSHSILEVNEKLRENQVKRSSLMQNISPGA